MESEVAKYLYELGQLKRVRRSGWWLAGLESPESVADHTFRAAAVAYVLALLEGANPERSAALALFHDSAETRLNDLHRVGNKLAACQRIPHAGMIHGETIAHADRVALERCSPCGANARLYSVGDWA